MPGRFKTFIEDLNEQERRAAEQRAVEQANRERIAAEFDAHWQEVRRNLKATVTGCTIKDSPFEWVEDADGINVASVGMHWLRTEAEGIPVVELTLDGPVGIRSFLAEQKKSLPPELHMLVPVISGDRFQWHLGRQGKVGFGAEYSDEDVADEMAMLLAQYADEHEKLRSKLDPFGGL